MSAVVLLLKVIEPPTVFPAVQTPPCPPIVNDTVLCVTLTPPEIWDPHTKLSWVFVPVSVTLPPTVALSRRISLAEFELMLPPTRFPEPSTRKMPPACTVIPPVTVTFVRSHVLPAGTTTFPDTVDPAAIGVAASSQVVDAKLGGVTTRPAPTTNPRVAAAIRSRRMIGPLPGRMPRIVTTVARRCTGRGGEI